MECKYESPLALFKPNAIFFLNIPRKHILLMGESFGTWINYDIQREFNQKKSILEAFEYNTAF